MNQHLQQQWIAKDRQYIWHPFTQMKDYAARDHILIERAAGAFLFDANGNRYYDTISSWWVNPHGHSHPRIRSAINEQMQAFDHVQFSGFTHMPAIQLAERLVHMTPKGLDKVFYSDNGSTAVEVALKMSFQYWQQSGKASKTKFVFLENSYHGDTLGAVSVGGVDLYHALYKPLLFHALKLPAPQVLQQKLNDVISDTAAQQQVVEHCLAEAARLFESQHADIAGIIVEPIIQAAGGMNIYPASYLAGLRKLCDQYEIHLIADEVAVGFVRTGKMFACEHAGISPDILCLSKALTGGVLPLSVTMCSNRIYEAFYDDYETYKTFFHGHGYTANAIACAAANASLDIFAEEHTVTHVNTLAKQLSEQLQTLIELPFIKNVRQLGLIAAFDLQPTDPSRNRIGFDTYLEGLKHGIILRPLGNVLYYWLPLCVNGDDLREIVRRTKTVLENVYRS